MSVPAPDHIASREPPALRVERLGHRFGSVRALVDVDVEVRAGEVHALVGENGAGKSTLVNVIAGLLVPDAGHLAVRGRTLEPGDRSASVRAGVGVVHQHFSLVETLTGAENFALGRLDGGRRIDRCHARTTLAEWARRTGLDVDPDVVVEDLTVAERQRLEILSTLGWGAEILLLDEPTAVLSPVESDQLLGVVRGLATDGLAVVLITHKLREVELHADRVTVMRAGSVVGRHGRDVARDVLVAEMIGDHQEDARLVLGAGTAAAGHPGAGATDATTSGATPAPASPVVRVAGLRTTRVRGIDLDLFGGEVAGIAAVAGSGQADVLGAICGLVRPADGTVTVRPAGDPDGEWVTVDGDPGRAARVGVALIPEDRTRDAIASELPVWVNAVAKRTGEISGRIGIDRARVRRLTDRVLGALEVRPRDHDLPAGRLSGGNQQRLVIGRELDRSPAVVLAAEPTRGLDPASALAVIEALRAAAARGAAVLVTANDLDELLLMSDRVLAMCDGRVTLDVPVHAATRQRIGRAMTGEVAPA